MTRLPLYDDTAPIACTASNERVSLHIEVVERMRAGLTGIERTEHGVLLHLPPDEAVLTEVRRFAVEEKRCCQFWGFEVGDGPDGTTLRWEGPPAVAAFFDELMAFFTSDEPLTAFSGLL